VHCGFCLPACPTYLATGDENDSPRGRIVLMQALERGDRALVDSALALHLENCLGCRGCEPACPSGVQYGRALETARRTLAGSRGLSVSLRALLAVFGSPKLWRPGFTLARWLRASGLPARLASRSRLGFAMGMLGATKRASFPPSQASQVNGHDSFVRLSSNRPTVALFRGCVMDTLFGHVHEATVRTLRANGFHVVEVPEQVCCGALHEHAGATAGARALAAANVAALGKKADVLVVNSAGCGAMLKDYGEFLGTTRAQSLAARVRDISEFLSEAGPRPGAPLPCDVAYDAACHLQHAQGVVTQPLDILRAVPGLRLQVLPGSDQCCGSAGLYSVLRPSMARAVLEPKINAIASLEPRPEFVATGNPGCLMQIGAGLLAAGLDIDVVHPVELLDRSYALAGYY
jgi:glycolate oxidase iron-sulfur subunit